LSARVLCLILFRHKLQAGGGAHNVNSTEDFQVTEVMVTGNDEVGAAFHGTRQIDVAKIPPRLRVTRFDPLDMGLRYWTSACERTWAQLHRAHQSVFVITKNGGHGKTVPTLQVAITQTRFCKRL